MENEDRAAPVEIIPDKPINTDTGFGFEAYIKTLTDLIANSKNETPLVIGIYGEWGSGKTTLMRSVQKELDTDKRYAEDNAYRKCKTVWFQAWKYDNEQEILAGLIEEIFKKMETDDFFEKCKADIEKIVAALKPTKLLQQLVKSMTGVSVGEFFGALKYKDKLGFYDIFQEFFDRLVWSYLNWRPKKDKQETTNDENGALVIFIDDLDRCPRSRIIKILETIKLFMDKEGCVFVIGASNAIIMDALKDTYKEGAERFMDKIVQVTFNLPRISEVDFKEFCEKHCSHIDNAYLEYLPLILPALNNNPRNLKRFFNDLSLLEALIKNKKIEGIEGKDLLLWNIIEYRYPSFRKNIKGSEFRSLSALHETVDKLKKEDASTPFVEIAPLKQDEFPAHLKTYANDRELLKIIDTFRCNKTDLEQLLTLTGIVESQEESRRRNDEKSGSPLTGDNMVKIPAGTFLAGDEKEKKTIERAFEIDIYPVTNWEYKKFMAGGGYSDKKFWEKGNAWDWKEKNNILKPAYMDNEKFNDPEQPVVGVSWYEAAAYTQWLTHTNNDGYKYQLPTEWEWEKAARGEDGRKYPWGNEFDVEKCNSVKSKIGKTTRVTVYPNGRSPYGCYDMAGNVWEWTSSFEGKNPVLRGGAFFDSALNCRCASRYGSIPDDRAGGMGFRCLRIKL